MRRCPSCSADIPGDARFCPACGRRAETASDPSEAATAPTTDPPSAAPSTAPASRTTSDDHLATGTLIASRYRIIGRLGRGGMGVVYRADDLTLDQPVALKFLPPDLALHPRRLNRFLAEVRTARTVAHPNVCRVYDIGSFESDRGPEHFISMELVRGEDLASLLKRIGRLAPDKAIEIARQVCAGLAAAHDRGIVHRDLKPANIMLDEEGRARITDFGIAAIAEEIAEDDRASGTPQYMSPEQLAGHPLDKRTDIYSLGLVLYEIFTGERYVKSRTIEEIRREHETGTRTLSDSRAFDALDPAVQRVIERCLDPDPARRPPSAFAVSASLPGGDPLAAALAAGETPSPELLASAGAIRSVNPLLAVGALAIGLAATLAILFINAHDEAINRASLPRSTEVLQDNARQIISQLGYTDEPADTALGWSRNTGYLDHIKESDDTPDRWERLRRDQPPSLTFWHRQSPRKFEPNNALRNVFLDDPPLTGSGMILLVTTPAGRMHTFYAVPPRIHDPAPPNPPEPDWNEVFQLAGLDPADFEPIDERYASIVETDVSRAWQGHYPESPDIPLTVYAGALDGKLVHFSTREPWEKDYFTEKPPDEPEPLAQKIADWGSRIVVSGAVLIGAYLTWRNFKLGRVDRRGAFRTALIIFVTAAGGALLQSRTLPRFDEMVFGRTSQLATAALVALNVAIFYLAVEPYARRYFPNALVTWARLGAGKLSDPLVGRDLLIGLGVGALITLGGDLGDYLPVLAGGPVESLDYSGGFSYLLGTTHVAGLVLHLVTDALVSSVATLLVLALLRLLFRSNVAAIIGIVGVAVLISGSLDPINDPYAFVFNVVGNLAFVLILVRFGLFALFSIAFVSRLLRSVPVSLDLDAWYAAPAILPLSLLAALAVFAFVAATRGRPLLTEDIKPATAH